MKKLFLLLGLSLALVSCKEDNVRVQSYNPQVTVQPTAPSVGDNLNLEALGELVRSSNSAQEIEDRLNAENSINNLDLDGDGQVDYIKVSEYGSGNNRGFSFVVPTADNDVIEVAKVEVNPNGEMNVNGNPTYYGDNYYHRAHYSASDMMIMAYLLSNHRPYYSPYHYGYYPSHYRSYRSQPVTTYRTRVTTTTRTSRPASYTNTTKTTTRPSSSYNTQKASSVSAPVSARAKAVATPTASQKSFKVTSPANSRPVVSGFGKNKTTSTATRPSSGSAYKSSGSGYRKSSGSGFGSSSKSSSRPSSGSYSSGSRKSSSSSSSYSSSSSRSSSSGFGSSSRSSSSRSSSRSSRR